MDALLGSISGSGRYSADAILQALVEAGFMTDAEPFLLPESQHPPRVVVDVDIMGGIPCLAGSRLPAKTLLGMVDSGDPWEVIVDGWPWLTPAHVEAARRWFADSGDGLQR